MSKENRCDCPMCGFNFPVRGNIAYETKDRVNCPMCEFNFKFDSVVEKGNEK